MFTQLGRRILAVALIAQFAALASFAASDASAKDDTIEPAPRIEMAILLDTSGSMKGLIDQARTQIWKIVNEFTTAKRDGLRPQLFVALYEYGKSSLPAKDGFMRQIVPLTDDLDKVSEELFKLTTNGGSEHCGQVIDLAAKDLKWSKSNRDLKCIFIAGNEPFTQGPIDYEDACKAAAEKGVMVSTIFCGPHEVGVQTEWNQGALLADGSYMSINKDQVVPHVAAPQDKKIQDLNTELNKTYVAYGGKQEREQAKERQLAQDKNASGASPEVAAQRIATKASAYYSNARWDLCDAVCVKKMKLEDIPVDQLPENLQKMSVEERKAYIEKMMAQRNDVQAQIKSLSAERETYVAAELKKLADGSDNTLDVAVIEACRKAAAKRSFTFEK